MGTISNLFLRARHWQIFILIFATYVAGAWAIVRSIDVRGQASLFNKYDVVFFLLNALAMCIFLAWCWAMGSLLNSVASTGLRLEMRFFRFALIYPALYLFFFAAAFESNKLVLILLTFPLHFFAMFCLFYNFYFVSKSLVTVETGTPALFSNYAGPFFLLWFFPVGIWIIQPRINRLYAAQRHPV